MTELYSKEYISKLKKDRALKLAAFFVYLAAAAALYVLSIVFLKNELISMLTAVLGVLTLSLLYILTVCPRSAQLSAYKEAAAGLKNQEEMRFESYGGEQLKNGVYYVTMVVAVNDEEGRIQVRELLVEKGLQPDFYKGEIFMGVTFQRVLQGYQRLGTQNAENF